MPITGSCAIYLDSSGDPGWPAPFGKSVPNWYVVSGLVLAPEADHNAHLEVERILTKYIPDSQRNSYPVDHYEIHYHKLAAGRNLFSHMDHPARKQISDEIFALIKSLNPVLFATAINKIQLKRVYGWRAFDPKILALQATIHRFSMYLDREHKLGSIVVDEEEYKRDRQLQAKIHAFRTT